MGKGCGGRVRVPWRRGRCQSGWRRCVRTSSGSSRSPPGSPEQRAPAWHPPWLSLPAQGEALSCPPGPSARVRGSQRGLGWYTPPSQSSGERHHTQAETRGTSRSPWGRKATAPGPACAFLRRPLSCLGWGTGRAPPGTLGFPCSLAQGERRAETELLEGCGVPGCPSLLLPPQL